MIDSQILQPVVVLMAWTMIMWLWMYATRIPAMSKAKIQPDDARKTGTLDERLPEQVQWKAHNYNHLHEQPTLKDRRSSSARAGIICSPRSLPNWR